jgi:hypothetical protein
MKVGERIKPHRKIRDMGHPSRGQGLVAFVEVHGVTAPFMERR